MAVAIIEAVVTLLAIFHETELGKELDHEAYLEVKSLHAKAHGLRKRIHSKVHHVFHKHPPKEPV